MSDILPEEVAVEGPGDFETVKLRQSVPDLYKPKKQFFYERTSDGMIFAAGEEEAATQNYAKVHKYIGFSNGLKFVEVLRAAKLQAGKSYPKGEAEDILRQAYAAEQETAIENMKEAKRKIQEAKDLGDDIPRLIPHPRRTEWSISGINNRNADAVLDMTAKGGKFQSI